jgi:hypothetical protein
MGPLVFFSLRDSSVRIALGYGPDDRGYRVRFPAGAGIFSLRHRVQTGSGVHSTSPCRGTGAPFPGNKAACEADHSPLSSDEVKNALNYNSTLHGVVLNFMLQSPSGPFRWKFTNQNSICIPCICHICSTTTGGDLCWSRNILIISLISTYFPQHFTLRLLQSDQT